MDALEQARREIDTVDAQLAALFERRMKAVLSVAEYKKAHGLPIFDAAREKVVLDKAEARIEDPALRPYYRDHVQNMMDVANFNRGTNQFNAQADNQFALAANQNNQWKAQSLMNYAAQKAAQDQQWYSDMYGNVNNLLKGISDYGRENMFINQINNGAINGVYGGGVVGKHSGGASYTAAKGGKLNKKKRRGYTF